MTTIYDWLKTTAKAGGSRKAIVYRDNYLSWRGFLHRVDRRSRELSSMGIKSGDWVGLMLGNVPDFIVLALALSKLEATIVPIDPTTGTRELELMLAAAPLRSLVTRPRGSEGSITATGAVRDGKTKEDEIPELRKKLQGTLLTCSVFTRPEPRTDLKPTMVMFTADSVGDPKGVCRTHDNLEAAVTSVISALDITKESRVLTAVPLYHAYGWDLGLLPTIKTGATMFLEEEASARRVGKIIREQKIDILPGTPTIYSELSKLPTAKKIKAENPKFLSSGCPLPDSVHEAFTEKYETPILSAYFLTEAGLVSLDADGEHPDTVGTPVEGIELKRLGKRGGNASGTKEGAIWIKGDAIAAGSVGPYTELAKPEEGVTPIGMYDDDGWFRTGDQATVDKAGNLMLTTREDELVKIEGKRVALGEIVGCIEAFPNIKEAKAVVILDPITTTPIVIAQVVPKGKRTPDAEDIIDHCAKNLAPYKVPRRIELVESL